MRQLNHERTVRYPCYRDGRYRPCLLIGSQRHGIIDWAATFDLGQEYGQHRSVADGTAGTRRLSDRGR